MSGFYIHDRWFLLLSIVAVCCVVAYFIPPVWYLAMLLLVLLVILSFTDTLLLFAKGKALVVERHTAERWHLGEDNVVSLSVENQFGMPVHLEVIDELPVFFQKRDFMLRYQLPKEGKFIKQYDLKPLERGAASFGNINVFVMSPLKLLKRRIIVRQASNVKVYPTTKLIKAFQLLAVSDQNNLLGAKKIRKLGHSLEFEQIKEYVSGDDIRTINWKATARRGGMMVNTFTDIRSQQIYCLIDKGRSMKMPFEGMTLMDHAIKAALVLLNLALHKHDKAGLITFSSSVNEVLPAEQGSKQMQKVLDALYYQKTDFEDADYEKMVGMVHHKLSQRSFLLLFTNFESLASLERQLPYLRALSKRHLLCVVFFENTAIRDIVQQRPDSIEGIYTQTIAERFAFEKRQMVKELRRYGIIAVLTTPEKLTVDVINNYLELRSRQTL